ncbi:hypothetical protein [Halomonas ramblicola]|uniref:hypothetical protein n=1 Tax=Halomonas ramblicola TaxID=747349 RepID=UPI0025B30467|nr:hypothetical protein [Halomonas ramblicola]MDN3522929.1 hypothetical protein [Halomonas ramblicola]
MKKVLPLLFSLFIASTNANEVGVSEDDRKAIENKLDAVESMWSEGDYEGIAQSLYVEETWITGEDTPDVYTGMESLTDLVKYLVDTSNAAELTMVQASPVGENGVISWVNWYVTPTEGEDFVMKSLMVWEQHDGDWKVMADMYATGEIGE